MKRAFLYVRVSTDEQKKHGLSIDSQLVALQEYCSKNGIEVAGIYNDAGRSAHASYLKRKELLKLIDDANARKGDIILFTKLDRWFRNLKDYFEVMAKIPEDIPWKAIWEDYETETSAGRFKVNIMLSIAQAEAERTSERIHSTLDYKRAKGDYIGSAPYGYKRKDNRLVKDPEAEPIVNAIFETYLKTHSCMDALRKSVELGHYITRKGILDIVKNPTYTGNAKGTKCEPYITEEQHQKLLSIVSSAYRKPKNIETVYLFQRLCVCAECGLNLQSNVRMYPNKTTKYNNYYCHGYNRTRHEGFALSERKLEKYLINNIEQIVRDYNIMVQNTIANDKEYNEVEKKRKNLESKLERIGVRFELGDITIEEYKNKRLEIKRELDNIKYVEHPTNTVTLPENWKVIYDQLDKQHKQQFWFSIIDKIEITRTHEIKVFFN